MRLFILFLIALGFTIVSCHNNPDKKTELKNTDNDTIIRDIPEWYSTSNYGQKRDKQLNAQLNLESLQNGFDSLSIRIWIDCGYDISSLIVIELTRSRWNATFYSFKIHYDEQRDIEVRNMDTKSRSPKSGWRNFSDNLLKTGIINLPDAMNFSAEYKFPTDADRILVEIGMLKKYRLYEYPELGINSDIAGGPGKLHQALKLIEREFDYRRPCQDSTGVMY